MLNSYAKAPADAPLQFVPAIISPNMAIDALTPEALQDLSNEDAFQGETITLDGVSPQKTLSQLRQAPKVNTAALTPISLKVSSPEMKASLDDLARLQEQISETDLKRLWQATIEHNQIVRFSLEKISLPAEHHMTHSSEFLRKTMSVLVSGAAMASTAIAPTSGYQNMTVLTSSQVAQNYITNRHKPLSDLSPTEHIQLSYLIDELKENLVTHYHQYQKAVYELNAIRKIAQVEEGSYLKTQAAHSAIERMMAVQRYYTYRDNLLKAETRAEHARVQLERLAGNQAVDNLALGVRPEASHVALNQPAPSQNSKEPKVIAKDESNTIQITGKTVGAAASISPLQDQKLEELGVRNDVFPNGSKNPPSSPKDVHRVQQTKTLHKRRSHENVIPTNSQMELPLMEDVSL